MLSFALYALYFAPAILIVAMALCHLRSWKWVAMCLIGSLTMVAILSWMWPNPTDEFGMIFTLWGWLGCMVIAIVFFCAGVILALTRWRTHNKRITDVI